MGGGGHFPLSSKPPAHLVGCSQLFRGAGAGAVQQPVCHLVGCSQLFSGAGAGTVQQDPCGICQVLTASPSIALDQVSWPSLLTSQYSPLMHFWVRLWSTVLLPVSSLCYGSLTGASI